MKMMVLVLVLLGGAASAQESFRAAGCDPEGLEPVLSADGETILYWQNVEGWSGCSADTGRGPDANDLVAAAPPVVIEPEPEPKDPVDPKA